MSRERTNIPRHATAYLLLFGIIVEIISLFITGFSTAFLAGIIIGTSTAIINYILLGSFVENILSVNITKYKLWLGITIYVLRLLIFLLTIYLCAKIGIEAVIAYSLCAINIAVTATISYVKEGGK